MVMVRRCREKDCVTILSRYNPQDRCFLHARPIWHDLGRPSVVREQELEGRWMYGTPKWLTVEDRRAYLSGEWLGDEEAG